MTDTEILDLPNSTPRPKGEEETLLEIWKTPIGWRLPTAVNNTAIWLLYIGAAFTFFVLEGILALVMRFQPSSTEKNSESFLVRVIQWLCLMAFLGVLWAGSAALILAVGVSSR